MEKLLELLSESTNGRFKSEQDLRLCIEMRGYCRDFIKWLVDNDKIDYQKSPGEIMFDDLMGTMFSLEDSITMMLSISDTPIEDLISYLK